MVSQNAPLIALAAGGTAGHVFPAEALAAELAKRGCRLALITDERGGAMDAGFNGVQLFRIRAGGIAGKGLAARIKSALEILAGTIQAWFILKRIKPQVVVGFGGYASVPTMLAAKFCTAKTAMHEQNAVLGRANRLLAGGVSQIATSFDKVAAMPEVAAGVIRTGMPVRPAVAHLRSNPYPERAPAQPIDILVFGGSQGASVFTQVVPAAIARLEEDLRARLSIVQQCRSDDLDAATAAYRDMGVAAELASFFDDLPARMAAAHLIICRSGASTIAEATTIGRPAIMVPYPHAVDDHQATNAHALDEAGGGWLLPEEAFTPEILAGRLTSLLTMPRILENAAAASKAFGRPDAASRLADMVAALLPAEAADVLGGQAS
ncbi:MAG: undecaprenyldiphospho-muramoylpentapeptide beta-N-acetylglucosaminyltransferase [Rhodospirillaceae bacterium]|nr:undecaprenyldiphospho-muramoylpentapeptide beta-N-acetylglucosaminyltransferase [Rhodospirillaceae bacterium]